MPLAQRQAHEGHGQLLAAAGRQRREPVHQNEHVAGIAAHPPHQEPRGRLRELDAAAADPELHGLQPFLVRQRLQLPDLSRSEAGAHVVTLEARPGRRAGRRQNQPRTAPFEFPAQAAHRLLDLGCAGNPLGRHRCTTVRSCTGHPAHPA